jgi:hypothetical protein
MFFTEEGVEITGPNSHTQVKWNAFIEARETSDQLLLYPQESMAHLIPKRFISSPADLSVLREVIRTHIAKSKLGK